MTAASPSSERDGPRSSSRRRSAGRPNGLLKIGDLAHRTGLSVAAIRFYIRDGLLPRPTMKTSPNMAYYDASFVERILLIKRLQEHAGLPLAMIRATLNEGTGDTVPSVLELEARSARYLGRAQPSAFDVEALARETSLDREELEELVELGLLGTGGGFGQIDSAIVATIARGRALGLSREVFPTRDLAMYLRAVRCLLFEELRVFVDRTHGRPLDASAGQLVEASVEVVPELIRHLRKRLILQLLGESSGPTSPTDTSVLQSA